MGAVSLRRFYNKQKQRDSGDRHVVKGDCFAAKKKNRRLATLAPHASAGVT